MKSSILLLQLGQSDWTHLVEVVPCFQEKLGISRGMNEFVDCEGWRVVEPAIGCQCCKFNCITHVEHRLLNAFREITCPLHLLY